LNYPDVTSSLHVRSDLFRKRDVKAFIAVPVYHAGQVAGVLELRFARVNSFREADLRTAELMAGLLSEAMVTAARMKWKEALASERQSMLEALERIKPQIERLGSESMASVDAPAKPLAWPAGRPAAKHEPSGRIAETCSACGSDFFDESESFCGTCGTARPVEPLALDIPSVNASGKTDPPWLIPYGRENPTSGNSAADLAPSQSVILKDMAAPENFPFIPAHELESAPQADAAISSAATKVEAAATPLVQPVFDSVSPAHLPSLRFESAAEVSNPGALRIVPADMVPADIVPGDMVAADPLVPPDSLEPYPWGSAKKAQQWLETVKTHQGPRAEWLSQQWQRRRANIYLGMAAVILLLVIFGWGIRPAETTSAGNSSPAQSSQPQTPAPPQLTLFEKLMVELGLAEPPPVPVDLGNPNAQVWVDVHTALYYCSGSELFGKTADGKFATQRDAQQDQFEPSNRKACP
jgi:GAF domain